MGLGLLPGQAHGVPGPEVWCGVAVPVKGQVGWDSRYMYINNLLIHYSGCYRSALTSGTIKVGDGQSMENEHCL